VALDRYRATEAEPPEHLLRYDPGDWSGEEFNPSHPERLAPVQKHIQWAAARRQWVREHVTTKAQFDRLFFAADVVYPEEARTNGAWMAALLTGHRDWVDG
jgi:hypothetical protein